MRGLFPESGWFAPDDATRALRLALVKRRSRVAALEAGGLKDPVTLSRLGLHASAATGFDRAPRLARRWAAEAVTSYFAAGRPADARATAESVIARPGQARLALALAAIDAELGSRVAQADTGKAVAVPRAGGEAQNCERRLAAGDRSASAWSDLFQSRGMSSVTGRGGAEIVLETAQASGQAVRNGEPVSVIMPVWNTADHVGAAVRSVLDQGWRNLELILVDDASTDGSIEVARQAADGDPRLQVLRQSSRRGPYVARNRALTAATGRWIAFHDADEWAHPDRLRVQIGQMTSRGLVASAGRSVRIDSAGRPRARGVWPLVRFAPSTMMIDRKRVLDRAGLMHEVTSGADNEYWWRMTLLFGPRRVALLPHLLILGAWRDGSQTVSAQEGYGAGGVNLSRLAYWEGWNRWHLSCRRRPGALKLAANAKPFAVPPELEVPAARGPT